jgi:L-ribulose-5-phosphate 3-epimerase
MSRPPGRIGVCSWSLRAGSPEELARVAREAGVDGVQLALVPLARDEGLLARTQGALSDAGVAVLSGMLATAGEDYTTLDSIRRTGGLRPDARWEENLARAREVALAAERLGLTLVSFHAGFLTESPGSPERRALLDRLRAVVDVFAERGVEVALETGQERAEVLLAVLAELERPSCGVNFDPANMILYGTGDPVRAFERLARLVLQIHVKDARASKRPGEWGEEVPAGDGEVDWRRFFEVYREKRLDVDLVIEREAGDDRAGDVARARDLVRRELEPGGAAR